MNSSVLLQHFSNSAIIPDLDLSCTEAPQCDEVGNTCPDMRPTPARIDTSAALVLTPLEGRTIQANLMTAFANTTIAV